MSNSLTYDGDLEMLPREVLSPPGETGPKLECREIPDRRLKIWRSTKMSSSQDWVRRN